MSIPLRVRHLLSSQKISLSEFILSQLEISSEYFFELLDLGSIYLNQERCTTNQVLSPGDYVRVHMAPKRFPALPQSTEELIAAQEKDFIIIKKPQGYPCHPLVDNCREDLLTQLQTRLKRPLYLTHRLDIGTGGLWLLALTPEFQKQFNQMLQDKKVEKKYFARVEGKWDEKQTRLVHYMKPGLRAPREIFAENENGFQRCELEITKIFAISESFSDLQIHLLTGRTHQIRAQMGFMGYPIHGDTMYGSRSDYKTGNLERWTLWASNLNFETDKKYQFELSEKELSESLKLFV
jgi:RluA family pseudouridine synthase